MPHLIEAYKGDLLRDKLPLTCQTAIIPETVTSKNVNDIYLSDKFLKKSNVNDEDVSTVLKDIRMTNINHIIIDHLNVNSFADKLDSMKLIIPGNIDVMVIGDSYPISQFLIDGFSEGVVFSYTLGRTYQLNYYSVIHYLMILRVCLLN